MSVVEKLLLRVEEAALVVLETCLSGD